MKYSATYLKRASGLVLFVCLAIFGLPVMAQTSDGATPAEETVCDGLDEVMFGICIAYCEAMDCDNPDHKASNKACQNKVQSWAGMAGDVPLPCNEGSAILMTKTVNASADSDFEIPVGDPVIYTFTITNSGNVPVVIMALSDAQIASALDDCTTALVGQTLAVNESITCMSDAGEILAIAQTVENTATVSATSIYGTPLSAQGTAIYTGSGGTVPVEFSLEPNRIFLSDGLVSELWVIVAPEWLESDVVSLAIEISGINAGFHEHGSQELLVSATELIAVDNGEALVSVDWTTDLLITHSPETYTACVQAMVDGQPFGLENCAAFGPF